MNMSAATSAPMPTTDWEFLLQKEGDRSWLPLDSPNGEILEGRYRVVARSGRPQTTVEIRVIHLATHETPPKRRAQSRSGRTNADGLMVVTPYTVMQPGIWELSCFSDVMSDLSGDSWRHSVRLHVLSRDSEVSDDWEPDWHQPGQTQVQFGTTASPLPSSVTIVPPSANGVSSPIAGGNADDRNPWRQEANQLSQQIADDVAGEFDAMVAAEPLIGTAVDHPLPVPPEVVDRPTPVLQVVLHQESYMIQRGGKLTLAGQVMLASSLAASSAAVGQLPEVDRIISLRDPQSSQVLLHHQDTLAPQSLPAPFTCELLLPLELSTRLMLGEVSLSTTDQAKLSVLASQSFTVVSALNELLDAIADTAVMAGDRFDGSNDADIASNDHSSGEGRLNLAFLEAVNAPKTPWEKNYSETGDKILPPQLYHPEPTPETSKKTLDLPNFAPMRPQDVPPELSPTSESAGVELETPTAAVLTPPVVEEVVPSTPDASLPPEPTLSSKNSQSVPTAEATHPMAPEPPKLLESSLLLVTEPHTYPITDEFRALKLQERFLDRLTALATDVTLSEELKEKVPLAERLVPPPTEVELEVPEAIDYQAELLAREVVVDDPAELASRSAARPAPPTLADTLPPEMVLPEHQDVPVPALKLSHETLVAGQAFTVQVKIPNLLPRLYVKLWINDRQTRTLLEGPRWLVDFTPDGLGQQETLTELTVPFGSVEIDIAAIAVEMSTHRESYKAALNLPVIPAEMPVSVRLEGFE